MTATLVATTPLAYSTTYTVVATTGITATSGAALAAETRWSFTTTGVPKAVRINSGGGAYSGSTGQWDADAQFRGGTVRTVTSAISNTPDPSLYQNERNGAWLYNVGVPAGTYDVVLHFAETLKTGAGQRVFHVDILDTAAVNDVASLDVFAAAGGANRALVRTIAGVTVTDGTVSISPKTVTDLPTISAIEVIPVLPTATAWTPSTGATNVAAGVAPTVTFSRAMNAASINANTVTLQHSSGALVAATVAYDAGTRVATLTPSAALTGGTYTARVDGSVMAADGMTMGAPATWSFSTAYGAPTVTSATPADGATGVALDVEPTAGFSREMDATTIGGSSFTLTPAGGTAVAATVAYDAATRTATLTPAAPLTASTVYTAKLETTIKASDGAALDSAVQWSFTTSAGTGGSASAPNGSGETPSGSTQEPAPTTDEAPTVTDKTPAADAVDVELDVAPTAQFSIAMDESSIDGTSVTIRAGDTAVEATVSYDAETRIVKVTPKAALEPGTKYDVRLGTGIKSADGVALAGAVSWSFTTK